MIWTLHKISYGSLSPYLGFIAQDINIKEFHLILPLLFLSIYYGIFPST